MATLTAYATVPYGPYFGCTAAQLNAKLAILTAAKLAAVGGASGTLNSASVNGRSFGYTNNGKSLESEIAELLQALAWVDVTVPLTSSQQVAVSPVVSALGYP